MAVIVEYHNAVLTLLFQEINNLESCRESLNDCKAKYSWCSSSCCEKVAFCAWELFSQKTFGKKKSASPG